MRYSQPLKLCKSDVYRVEVGMGEFSRAPIHAMCLQVGHPDIDTIKGIISPNIGWMIRDGWFVVRTNNTGLLIELLGSINVYTHSENASPFPYWIEYEASNEDLFRIDAVMGSRLEEPFSAWQSKISQGKRVLMFRTEEDREIARLCL